MRIYIRNLRDRKKIFTMNKIKLKRIGYERGNIPEPFEEDL